MKKQVIVLSLGGSLIVPNELNLKYLKEFKKAISKNTNKFKFIIVCGGGSTARKYIRGLDGIKSKNKKILQAFLGIDSTRLNSRFVQYFFFNDPKRKIISTMKTLKREIKKKDVIFWYGTFEYEPKKTSDSAAAEVATKFKAIFVNLTNVDGLFDKNPKRFKDSKLISKISWADFYKKANELKYKPGQHFILDQTASKIIMENKIPTYILGQSMKNLNNFLKGKKFKGTTIKG